MKSTSLFHLIEPSADYSAEFTRLAKDTVPWLAVNPSIPPLSEALSKLKTQLRETNPDPFLLLNNTVSQIYAFFKSHMRQPEDAPRDSPDSEFTVLVCSDAPDFYEGDSEPRLKTLRLPIATAFHYLDAIDQLTITPSEIYTLVFEDQYTNILRMRPLPCLTPIPPYTDDLDEQLYKLGSFAEMRERKKQGLRLGEQPLGALGSL